MPATITETTYICGECGRKFTAANKSWYCPKCKKVRKQRSDKLRRERERVMDQASLIVAESRPRPKMSLSEISRAAAMAGMTYGEYVRKMECG